MLRWLPEKAPTPDFLRDGDLAVFAGARLLDGPVWEQLGEASQVGISLAVGPRRWWLRPVVGLQYAHAEGDYRRSATDSFAIPVLGDFQWPAERGTISTGIWETDVGAMSDWRLGPFHQRVSGGLCWVKVDLKETPQQTIYTSIRNADLTPRQDSDAVVAWWLATSLTATMAGVELGFEGRLTDARMRLFNQAVQGGGYQVGATAAYVW